MGGKGSRKDAREPNVSRLPQPTREKGIEIPDLGHERTILSAGTYAGKIGSLFSAPGVFYHDGQPSVTGFAAAVASAAAIAIHTLSNVHE